MSYSVGVQNIFELLEDENDDQPDVRTPQTKLEDKKAAVNRPPPVGDNRPKAAQRDASLKKQVEPKMEGFTDVTSQKTRLPSTRKDGDRPRDNRGPRTDRPRREGENRDNRPRTDRPPREPREGGEQRTREPRPPREGREPRENRGPREDRPPREGREDRGPKEGQPRGDRDKEKYARENQNAPYDGKTNKRTHDRKSGTGRNPRENKKGGAGGANWGSETDPKEELAAEGQVVEDAAAEAKEVTAEGVAEVTEETPASPVVPEKKEVSLAEFRKQREAALTALPSLPPPRQAGEGVNDKEKEKWATEALKKEEEKKASLAVKVGADKKEKDKKPTASLDQFFHIKPRERPKYDRDDREERGDRPDRGDRPRRDREGGDRPRRDDRKRDGKQGANKSEGAKKAPQGSAEPIVKTDVDFPTLNTKA